MKFVLIGDVGGAGGFHAGDEAMLEAAIDQIRVRGATDIVVISDDPIDTAARYGVQAIPRIGFPAENPLVDSPCDTRLDAVLELLHARGTASDRGAVVDDSTATARAVIEAVASSDGLIVTGGGNLSSSWPDHVYERVALLEIARHLRVPSIVTGQTLGPHLTKRQHELLAGSLGFARLVGLREQDSYEMADTLLPPTTPRRLQLDDAAFLGSGAACRVDGELDGVQRLPEERSFVALTLNQPCADGADELVGGFAEFVKRLQSTTGLPVWFIPHVGRLDGEPTGDILLGARLLERLGHGAGFEVAPLLAPRTIAALTRRAAAVVSTRYHPLVFGTAGAVPCLGITQDAYTATKLRGALRHAGLADWTVPLEAVTTGLAGELFDELWERRDEIARHLDPLSTTWRARQVRHWDEMWEAVTSQGSGVPVSRVADEPPDTLVPELVALADAQAVADSLTARVAVDERRWRASFRDAERYARSLEATLAARVIEIDGLHHALAESESRVLGLEARQAMIEAEGIQLLDDAMHAERSAVAARALAVDVRRQLDASAARNTEMVASLAAATAAESFHRARVDQLRATKTLRWTSALRRAWGRIRPGRRVVRKFKRRAGSTQPGIRSPSSAEASVFRR